MYSTMSDIAIVSINSLSKKLLKFIFDGESVSLEEEREFAAFLEGLLDPDMMDDNELKDILRSNIEAGRYPAQFTKDMFLRHCAESFNHLRCHDEKLPKYFVNLISDKFYKEPRVITNALAQSFQDKFKFQVKTEQVLTIGTKEQNEDVFSPQDLEKVAMTSIALYDRKSRQTYHIYPSKDGLLQISGKEVNEVHTDLILLLTELKGPREHYNAIEKYFYNHPFLEFDITL